MSIPSHFFNRKQHQHNHQQGHHQHQQQQFHKGNNHQQQQQQHGTVKFASPNSRDTSPSKHFNETPKKVQSNTAVTTKDGNGLFDPRLVLKHLDWSQMEKRVGPGLRNLGNTCFLNSTLQGLLHTPALSQIMLHESQSAFRNLNSNGNPIGMIYEKLAKLFWTCNGKVVVPNNIIQNIRRVGRQFRFGRQEDAHEFMIQLLDCMHEEILKANNVKLSDKDAETTFIGRIFGGKLCNELRCSQCKYSSKTYNDFKDLSLNVSGQINSVKAALDAFERTEKLSSGNEWKCDGCKKKVQASKQLRVHRCPNVLIIHLKRFSFNDYFGKINKHIAFDSVMEMHSVDSAEGDGSQHKVKKVRYHLYAAVVHYGSTMQSGHYVCFVRMNKKWFLMDDDSVQEVPEKEVLAQKVYILLYTRSKPTDDVVNDSNDSNNSIDSKQTTTPLDSKKMNDANTANRTNNSNTTTNSNNQSRSGHSHPQDKEQHQQHQQQHQVSPQEVRMPSKIDSKEMANKRKFETETVELKSQYSKIDNPNDTMSASKKQKSNHSIDSSNEMKKSNMNKIIRSVVKAFQPKEHDSRLDITTHGDAMTPLKSKTIRVQHTSSAMKDEDKNKTFKVVNEPLRMTSPTLTSASASDITTKSALKECIESSTPRSNSSSKSPRMSAKKSHSILSRTMGYFKKMKLKVNTPLRQLLNLKSNKEQAKETPTGKNTVLNKKLFANKDV